MSQRLIAPYHLITASEVDSTMIAAHEKIKVAGNGAKNTIFQADKQTAGRGRQARVWESPTGNLYTSIIIDPKDDGEHALGLYAQLTSLAVAETIERLCHLGMRLKLKWPNDVLIDGKKVSGLLLEVGQAHGLLVIGAGVNLKNHPEGLPYPATSLWSSSGHSIEAVDFLKEFIKTFDLSRQRLRKEGPSGMIEEWAGLIAHQPGDNITVRLPNREIKGQYQRLDTAGRIELRLEDGTLERFYSGDVFFG